MDPHCSLGELADATGIPERTIRFYIARGLVDGPARGGRGAYYTDAHQERIEAIQALQREGMTLVEIGLKLAGGGQAALPAPAAWWSYPMGGDVIVQVRAALSPWRMQQVQSALAELMRRLGQAEEPVQKGKKT